MCVPHRWNRQKLHGFVVSQGQRKTLNLICLKKCFLYYLIFSQIMNFLSICLPYWHFSWGVIKGIRKWGHSFTTPSSLEVCWAQLLCQSSSYLEFANFHSRTVTRPLSYVYIELMTGDITVGNLRLKTSDLHMSTFTPGVCVLFSFEIQTRSPPSSSLGILMCFCMRQPTSNESVTSFNISIYSS